MILGIESSCDESALAVFDPGKGLLVDLVYSQVQTHQEYGGIVPELASREHLEAFVPLLNRLSESVALSKISQIAVTSGPGLASCLALGIALGRSVSLALGVPLMGINHLRGHAYSPFIVMHGEDPPSFENAFNDLLPHLGLIVSGGNTVLFEIDEQQQLTVLGETMDDAAGEALDKGAKLLGMPYPGGPFIEKAAATGDANHYHFPRGMVQSADVKFSFSGLKTSLRYRLEKMSDHELEDSMSDLCASYQEAVVDALALKTQAVLRKGHYRSLGLSGGVANNRRLRKRFEGVAKKIGVPLLIAATKHTGDNAGMIAFAAFIDPLGGVVDGQSLTIQPSWKLSSDPIAQQ